MRCGVFLGCLSAFVLVATGCCIGTADAEPSYDAEYYCYTDQLAFIYGGGTQGDVRVEWSATGYDSEGKTVGIGILEPEPSADNGWRVKFNPDDVAKCEYVYVTQFVTKDDKGDVQTFKIILLDLPENGHYTVTFYDGYTGAALKVTEITDTGYVEVGKEHALPPKNPVRDGYSFLGWFVGADMNQPFDPYKPVESDMNVYAKWSETPAVSMDAVMYVLIGVIAVLAAVLAVVLVRMRQQRT